MDNIGGFFEFEIAKGNTLYHDNALALSTGRACLNYIIQNNPYTKYYVPYYCCDALYEPLNINNIMFEFYAINSNFELSNDIILKPEEALVYCNFFGIKKNYVNNLIVKYGSQLILDNSHSFFEKSYNEIISFTTARKYFGVPDGAFLYMPNKFSKSNLRRNINISIKHLVDRFLGFQDKAFSEFQAYEASLGCEIELISLFSENLLKTLDYSAIRKARNTNFLMYRNSFKSLNVINIEEDVNDCFCYPLLLPINVSKELFYKHNIFIPTYWKDVTNRKDSSEYDFECNLSNNILPLPIDHRYGKNEIKRVIDTLKFFLNE